MGQFPKYNTHWTRPKMPKLSESLLHHHHHLSLPSTLSSLVSLPLTRSLFDPNSVCLQISPRGKMSEYSSSSLNPSPIHYVLLSHKQSHHHIVSHPSHGSSQSHPPDTFPVWSFFSIFTLLDESNCLPVRDCDKENATHPPTTLPP